MKLPKNCRLNEKLTKIALREITSRPPDVKNRPTSKRNGIWFSGDLAIKAPMRDSWTGRFRRIRRYSQEIIIARKLEEFGIQNIPMMYGLYIPKLHQSKPILVMEKLNMAPIGILDDGEFDKAEEEFWELINSLRTRGFSEDDPVLTGIVHMI